MRFFLAIVLEIVVVGGKAPAATSDPPAPDGDESLGDRLLDDLGPGAGQPAGQPQPVQVPKATSDAELSPNASTPPHSFGAGASPTTKPLARVQRGMHQAERFSPNQVRLLLPPGSTRGYGRARGSLGSRASSLPNCRSSVNAMAANATATNRATSPAQSPASLALLREAVAPPREFQPTGSIAQTAQPVAEGQYRRDREIAVGAICPCEAANRCCNRSRTNSCRSTKSKSSSIIAG